MTEYSADAEIDEIQIETRIGRRRQAFLSTIESLLLIG